MAKFRQAAARAHDVLATSCITRRDARLAHTTAICCRQCDPGRGPSWPLRRDGAVVAWRADEHTTAAAHWESARDGHRCLRSLLGARLRCGDIEPPPPPLCPLHDSLSERRPTGRRGIQTYRGERPATILARRLLQDGSNRLMALSLSILQLSDLNGGNMIKE